MIKMLYKKQYSEYVSKYSQQYGVDENLIYALIKAESNFEVKAKSNKEAQGLMQLMYSTAKEVALQNGIQLTEENILEPDININIGTKYISTLLKRYKCIEIALAAYNAGSGNVDKWIEKGTIKADGSDIENIPFKETNNYVRKIMRDYKIYSEL
jgi:soluble lytic murein transglycosylase